MSAGWEWSYRPGPTKEMITMATETAPQEGTKSPSLSTTLLWVVLGLVLLADALDMIDSTVTNIAAPTIVRDIGGGQALIKWLGSSYALAMGVLLVVGGRLGDRFGQRRLFLIGMTGFTAASAVAGLSPDPGLLIVARAVQGAFGALLIPQGMAIMTKTFPRDMLGKAFGLFARRQRRAASPLLKPSLLTNRGFTSGLIVGLLFFAVTSGLIYVMSLFMQQALHASAGSAALGLLPLTIGIIIAAFACMALAQRLGRTLIGIGMLLTMAGAGWLLGLVMADGTGLSLWTLSPAVLLTGLGMGACFGTIYDIALGDIAPDEAGSASGSLTAIQQLANGIGSAVVTTVYFHSGAAAHAMAVSVITVLAITAACLPALRLLPRRTPAEPAEAGGAGELAEVSGG